MLGTLRSLCLGGLLGLSGCQSGPGETALEGEVQGTTYHIKLVPNDLPIDAAGLQREIEALFEAIDVKLSNYREDSEISRLNRQRSTEWLPVSPEIMELLQVARRVYERSHGCYDLTVQPLFELWGFSKRQNRVPTGAEIEEVLKHVGMSKLELDEGGSRIRKLDQDLRIDLSSIAQGYTVSTLAALLERHGISNYLAEIGGELKVKGRKANGKPWRVAIEKPAPFSREVQKILDIHQEQGTAVMTAGTYRNFFEQDGQIYSHILDPGTGRPVNHHLLSVTVLHDDPTWADAWDTALLCVGETEAVGIAESEHLKALLIYQQGTELKEHMSTAFVTAQEPPAPGPSATPAATREQP